MHLYPCSWQTPKLQVSLESLESPTPSIWECSLNHHEDSISLSLSFSLSFFLVSLSSSLSRSLSLSLSFFLYLFFLSLSLSLCAPRCQKPARETAQLMASASELSGIFRVLQRNPRLAVSQVPGPRGGDFSVGFGVTGSKAFSVLFSLLRCATRRLQYSIFKFPT